MSITRQSRHPVVVSMLAALALSGVGGRALAETKTVSIENMKFSPAVLTVKQGDTVVWRNADFFPHNVTAQGGGFRSGEIASNGSWKFIANNKGEFPYICTLHPTMTGTLIVK